MLYQNKAERVTCRDIEALMPNMQQNMTRTFYEESLLEIALIGSRGPRSERITNKTTTRSTLKLILVANRTFGSIRSNQNSPYKIYESGSVPQLV